MRVKIGIRCRGRAWIGLGTDGLKELFLLLGLGADFALVAVDQDELAQVAVDGGVEVGLAVHGRPCVNHICFW